MVEAMRLLDGQYEAFFHACMASERAFRLLFMCVRLLDCMRLPEIPEDEEALEKLRNARRLGKISGHVVLRRGGGSGASAVGEATESRGTVAGRVVGAVARG